MATLRAEFDKREPYLTHFKPSDYEVEEVTRMTLISYDIAPSSTYKHIEALPIFPNLIQLESYETSFDILKVFIQKKSISGKTSNHIRRHFIA